MVGRPASDIEIGGEGGREALKRLENTFDRVQATWRPATTDECFEIVRRRLFQPIEASKFPSRDAVAAAFADMYRENTGDYPNECRESEYERRLKGSYPIHPELFDRLFQDWALLDRFQKTRGVLRLMASVIHTLWVAEDSNLMIMPATVPLADRGVFDEAKKSLDDPWVSVVERDVDGPHSLPLRLDQENSSTLGRVSAARRVARTLFMGTAPQSASQNRGIDDRRIRLGCVQPGESSPVFIDALRRLSDQATHVYVDQGRYWLGTQPSVTRVANDRAAQLERRADLVHAEITRRLREEQNDRGSFDRVHPCPPGTGDVTDDPEARLVILGPEQAHTARAAGSPARESAREILEHRGTTARYNKNALIFIAPDKAKLVDLEAATRHYLAWKSIEEEAESLHLDMFQSKQARSKVREADETVRQRISETYIWMLVPSQSSPRDPVELTESKLQTGGRLAARASAKLASEGTLYLKFAGSLLRAELDRVPLWRGESVSVSQLIEDFAQYPHLPRLKDRSVLLDAVRDGVSKLTWEMDGFAYADGVDDKTGRFIGLKTASIDNAVADGRSQVVRPEAARRQLNAERALVSPTPTDAHEPTQRGPSQPLMTELPIAPSLPKRFYGVVEVDAARLGRDAGKIAQEIVAHLTGLGDASVRVVVEIQAERLLGFDASLVRAINENCRVLKFRDHGFEHG